MERTTKPKKVVPTIDDTKEDRRIQEEIRAKAGRSLAVLEKSFLRVSGRYVILSPHRIR